MSRKKYYLVIDTETCGTIEQPLAFDIGYAICDRFGNIVLERAYVVADIFCDLKEMMNEAYYSEKIPLYWEQIKSGKKELRNFSTIHKQIKDDMRNYRIGVVMAYNMAFDKRALNNTIRYCTKSKKRWFFPFGTTFDCIWWKAVQTLLDTKTYVNFALQNNLVSECGNILTSAESCYKYLTKNLDFQEQHQGLEDVRIEVEIFAKCIATHKKVEKGINTQCWRKVQKRKRELAGALG